MMDTISLANVALSPGISVTPVVLVHRDTVRTHAGVAILRTEWLSRECRYQTRAIIGGEVYVLADTAGSYDAYVAHLNWSDPWTLDAYLCA